MHDYVILQPLRQKEDFVVEVQIAKRRTASPPAIGVADGNPTVGITVVLIQAL